MTKCSHKVQSVAGPEQATEIRLMSMILIAFRLPGGANRLRCRKVNSGLAAGGVLRPGIGEAFS